MVAIDINGTIKTRNKIPNKWNGVLNYSSVNNTEMQIADGWRGVVNPVYNTATEKIGILYFDSINDNFTYQIIDLTQIEIDELSEIDDENQAREKIDNYRYKGGELMERTRTKMWRRVHLYPNSANGLTKPQVAKLERWMKDVYFNLLTGNFRQAKNDIGNLIIERGATGDSTLLETDGMLDTVTWLQEKITTFFNNNYDL